MAGERFSVEEEGAGITNNCSSDPLRFCPQDLNTRGEFVTHLVHGHALSATSR